MLTRTELRRRYLEVQALSREPKGEALPKHFFGRRHPSPAKNIPSYYGAPVGGNFLLSPPSAEMEARSAEDILHIDSRARATECLDVYSGHFLLTAFPRAQRTEFCKALLKGVGKFYPPVSIPSTWRMMIQDPDTYDELAVRMKGL